MKSTSPATAHIRLTRHASIRMQQRCIPLTVVELLLDYAEPTAVGGGALSYRFTRKTWDEAMAALGPTATRFAKFRNAYVIEASDGAVITAARLH